MQKHFISSQLCELLIDDCDVVWGVTCAMVGWILLQHAV